MNVITGQQCKEARFHLRWNVRDLAHHSSISARRINWFEEGKEPLYQEEMNTLIALYKAKEITFTEGGGVKLPKKEKHHQDSVRSYSNEEAARVLARLLQRDQKQQ